MGKKWLVPILWLFIFMEIRLFGIKLYAIFARKEI